MSKNILKKLKNWKNLNLFNKIWMQKLDKNLKKVEKSKKKSTFSSHLITPIKCRKGLKSQKSLFV